MGGGVVISPTDAKDFIYSLICSHPFLDIA